LWRYKIKYVKIYQKFVQNINKKPFPNKKKFGQKLILLAHSGENIIFSKLLFSLFSVTMGQKYAKFG
jgi:hypothetical protein